MTYQISVLSSRTTEVTRRVVQVPEALNAHFTTIDMQAQELTSKIIYSTVLLVESKVTLCKSSQDKKESA